MLGPFFVGRARGTRTLTRRSRAGVPPPGAGSWCERPFLLAAAAGAVCRALATFGGAADANPAPLHAGVAVAVEPQQPAMRSFFQPSGRLGRRPQCTRSEACRAAARRRVGRSGLSRMHLGTSRSVLRHGRAHDRRERTADAWQRDSLQPSTRSTTTGRPDKPRRCRRARSNRRDFWPDTAGDILRRNRTRARTRFRW